MRAGVLLLASILLMAAVPAPARADGILGAFIGTNFGGKTEANTIVFGGVLGAVQSRGLGFELDFGHTPDFFDTKKETGTKTSVTTVMANVAIGGAAARGVGPYVSGGLGLIRVNVSAPAELIENLTRNDFGINVGGGINAMFSSSVGVMGDIRYFRSFQSETIDDNFPDLGFDLGTFDFWRGAAGLVVRW